MDPSNETSFIKVLYGEDFQQGQIFTNLKVEINTNSALEQQTFLNQVTNNTIDVAQTFVLAISSKPENIGALYEKINTFINTDGTDEPGNNLHYTYSHELKPMFTSKVSLAGDKIYVSVKSAAIEQIIGPLLGFSEMLTPLTSESYNSIETSVAMNFSVNDFLDKLNSGDRLVSALLANTQVEIKASLSKNLGEKAKQVANAFDPSLAAIPPFEFLSGFGNLEVDFKFKSTQELPTSLRQKALGGQFSEIPAENRVLPPDFDNFLNSLLDFVETDLEVFFTVSQVAAIKLTVHAPDLTQFAKAYLGKILLN